MRLDHFLEITVGGLPFQLHQQGVKMRISDVLYAVSPGWNLLKVIPGQRNCVGR